MELAEAMSMKSALARDSVESCCLSAVITAPEICELFDPIPQSTIYRVLKDARWKRKAGGIYLYIRWEVYELLEGYLP